MNISDDLRDQFTEIFNIGVGRAAASLSILLGYKIDLNIPNLYFLNQVLFDEYLDKIEDKYICVLQQIHGDLEGFGSLSLPLIKGKTLVDNILNTEPDKPQFNAVEIEAIQEVGNIVINAIGGAFANVSGLRLEFDTPTVEFLNYPIPRDIKSNSENLFYTMASSVLGVKKIDVQGMVTLTFAYSNIELLERFIRGEKLLSKKFGELLLEKQYITQDQLKEAIQLQEDSRKFIGQLMVDYNYITIEQRDKIIQSQKYNNYKKKFGEILLKDNLITAQQLEKLLNVQKHSKSLLGEILVILGYIDVNARDNTLAIQISGNETKANLLEQRN